MIETGKISWQALEYEEKERSGDWFWALGVIVVAGSIAAIIFGDYFFAGLLILSGLLLGFLAIKKPDMISYELNDKGLKIRRDIFPYENIRAFYVEDETKSLLFVRVGRMFMPVFSMPIPRSDASAIKAMMLAHNVMEEKMKEHMSEKVMESLGF